MGRSGRTPAHLPRFAPFPAARAPFPPTRRSPRHSSRVLSSEAPPPPHSAAPYASAAAARARARVRGRRAPPLASTVDEHARAALLHVAAPVQVASKGRRRQPPPQSAARSLARALHPPLRRDAHAGLLPLRRRQAARARLLHLHRPLWLLLKCAKRRFGAKQLARRLGRRLVIHPFVAV
eukprot:5956772-Pleurochrysis_carterae.AAC.1